MSDRAAQAYALVLATTALVVMVARFGFRE
jgi:hypothetical protein